MLNAEGMSGTLRTQPTLSILYVSIHTGLLEYKQLLLYIFLYIPCGMVVYDVSCCITHKTEYLAFGP